MVRCTHGPFSNLIRVGHPDRIRSEVLPVHDFQHSIGATHDVQIKIYQPHLPLLESRRK